MGEIVSLHSARAARDRADTVFLAISAGLESVQAEDFAGALAAVARLVEIARDHRTPSHLRLEAASAVVRLTDLALCAAFQAERDAAMGEETR